MDALSQALMLVLFILPSYFANSIPVLLGGGRAIDNGAKMADGQRIFGDGKTVRGFFAGVLAALLIGSLEAIALPSTAFALYNSPADYVFAGFLLGLGTMSGDLLGSFIKRRQGISQGKPSLLLDQLTFLAVALIFSYPLAAPLLTIPAVLFLFILTYFVHVGSNVAANRLGLKKVPW